MTTADGAPEGPELRAPRSPRLDRCLRVARAALDVLAWGRSRTAVAVSALTIMFALGMTGCSGPTTQATPVTDEAAEAALSCGIPVHGQRVVIVVSGTAHEPRPSLSAGVEQLLRDAANSEASDGRGAKGSIVEIASADGQPAQFLPLTPRRANCAVEHGLQRDKLINDNIDRVRLAVAARSAKRPGLDLLTGIGEAVRGVEPGVLIIISNGLSTDGGVDLRKVGWHLDPDDLVDQLNQRGLLRDLLTGWQVVFNGLGETAGSQPSLTKPARDRLISYWTAICGEATDGGSCTVDEAALPPTPPLATAEVPVIEVEGISSAIGPDGRTTDTVAGEVLFAGDSAALSPDAQVVLNGIAARIAAKCGTQPGLPIMIRGYVADPLDSTPASRQATSDARALSVSGFLSAAIVSCNLAGPIDAAGAGTPPGKTAIVDGVFIEAIATQMRYVTIAY